MAVPAAGDIKSLYKDEAEQIFRAHRGGASGYDTAHALTVLTDRALTSLWEGVPFASKQLAAVIALGGYGRCEMCPHSDFDLMIVFADEEAKRAGSESAQHFLHALWDAGFDIGHSVRTIADCIRLYQTDVDVWASVLESRFVCGSAGVLDAYRRAMLRAVERGRDLRFVTSVLEGITERHKKYGNSVRLLEPNIKNSAGGLRDLHSLLWIYRATDTEYFGAAPFQNAHSACREMFDIFADKGLISREDVAAASAALDFLLRIRHEMHYGSQAIRDSLEFSTQREIARNLGYGAAGVALGGADDELKNVERFMREYFLHARTVYRLNQRLTQTFRRGTRPSLSSSFSPGSAVRRFLQKDVILDELYLLREQTVSLRNAAVDFSAPHQILSAFYWSAVHSAEIDPALLTRISAASHDTALFTDAMRRDARTTSRFSEVMALRKNAASALRAMNDTDTLSALIPKWAKLVAYVQHSMYHFYTVDAHTLLAIERAEELDNHAGLLGTAFRALTRRDILYFALLLHDIEKPTGISGHDARGAETAREILRTLAVDDPEDDVAFLIRNHLVMEQTAFRRNFHQPETITEFAALFSRTEQLDMLFLVTYCDLSAVNRNVWSSWKEAVLEDLYLRTLRQMERAGKKETTHSEELRAAVERTLEPLFSKEEIERHFASFDGDDYLHAFSADEIEAHLRQLRAREEAHASEETSAGSAGGGGGENTITVSFAEAPAYTAMTVLMQDRPSLLSTLCGVLSANDAHIIDAHIFTRSDAIVIDRFRMVDGVSKRPLAAAQTEKIASDTLDVLDGRETLEKLFEKHHRRWKRRPKPLMHPNIRIDVRFHDTERYTIIDVYGPDMTGFLYKVTQALARFGLTIHFAKISTRGDGIVDSFYVEDAQGRRLQDQEQRQKLREKIVHTIHQLITVQLGQ